MTTSLIVPSLWNAVPMVNQYKSFAFCMQAMPCIGDLARRADKAIPYGSTALKVVPLLVPEYVEAAMAMDDQLESFQWVYNQLRT